MNLGKIPAEVALAIADIIAKIIISVITSIIIVGLLWWLLDAPSLIGGFIGAMIGQIIYRVFDSKLRQSIKIVWYWQKDKSDGFPYRLYSSKKEKDDMAFINLMEGRGSHVDKLLETPLETSSIDDLKKSVNKSILDD